MSASVADLQKPGTSSYVRPADIADAAPRHAWYVFAIEAMSSDPSPAARDRVAEGFTALAGALDALNPALGLEG